MPTKRNSNGASKRAKSAAPNRRAKKTEQPSLLDETIDFSQYDGETVHLATFCRIHGFKVRLREREKEDCKRLGLGRYYAYIEGLFELSSQTPLDTDGRIPKGAILQSVCGNTDSGVQNDAICDLVDQLSGKTLILSRGEFSAAIIRAPSHIYYS